MKKKQKQPSKIESNEIAGMSADEKEQVSIWAHYYRHHAISADYLGKRAAETEEIYRLTAVPQDALDRQWADVVGAIFAAVAFLEATINEVFLGASETNVTPISTLQPLQFSTIASLARTWRQEKIEWRDNLPLVKFMRYGKKDRRTIDRWFILDKFQLALYLADNHECRKPFVKDGRWKEAELLIDLRNLLTHTKPEWISVLPDEPYRTEKDKTVNLMKGLEARGFANPLIKKSGYILDCLGSDCAKWAVNSSLSFVDEFSRRMPLKLHDDVRTLIDA